MRKVVSAHIDHAERRVRVIVIDGERTRRRVRWSAPSRPLSFARWSHHLVTEFSTPFRRRGAGRNTRGRVCSRLHRSGYGPKPPELLQDRAFPKCRQDPEKHERIAPMGKGVRIGAAKGAVSA